MNAKRGKLESKRKNLVQHLINFEPWIQGTVVKTERICGSKGCACRHGGLKHPAMFLTWKENGKTCCLYVPRRLEKEVMQWAHNYQCVKTIMTNITEVQRDIIRLRKKRIERK